MSNQQETSLAWLAGILDGEGSIGFNVRKRHKTERGGLKTHILPWVSMSTTSYEIALRCKEICATVGVGSNLTKMGRPTKANKTVWQWCIGGATRVRVLLPLVLPYLVLKGDRARMVMSFISSRKETGTHKTYTPQEWCLVAATREGSSETTRETPYVQ